MALYEALFKPKFGDKSDLLAQGVVFLGAPVIDCSPLGSTATLIRPLRLGHCIYMYLWKVAIHCLCKCHIRIQTEERCD